MNYESKKALSGVIAIFSAAVLFGFLPIWCKQLLNNGVDSQTLVFLRYGFACIILAVLMPIFKIPFSVTKRELVALIMFGIIGGGVTSFFLSMSYTYMYAGIATMFHFSYPLFVALIMTVFFREKLTWKVVVSIALAVCGMVLMADINGSFSLKGIVLALISGFTLATYLVATKKSAFSNFHPMKIVFYVSLVSTVFLGIKQLIGGDIHLPATASDWVRMVFIALLCTVISHSLLAFGIQRLGATTGALISMLEPVVSVVAGALIINEVPSPIAIVGCVLVFSGILIIAINKPAPAQN